MTPVQRKMLAEFRRRQALSGATHYEGCEDLHIVCLAEKTIASLAAEVLATIENPGELVGLRDLRVAVEIVYTPGHDYHEDDCEGRIDEDETCNCGHGEIRLVLRELEGL